MKICSMKNGYPGNSFMTCEKYSSRSLSENRIFVVKSPDFEKATKLNNTMVKFLNTVSVKCTEDRH